MAENVPEGTQWHQSSSGVPYCNEALLHAVKDVFKAPSSSCKLNNRSTVIRMDLFAWATLSVSLHMGAWR